MERTPGGAMLLDGDQAQYDAEPTEALQFVEEGQDQRYAFARISHLILRDKQVSKYAKLVYCVSRTFLGASGAVHPTHQTLADLCGVSKRTVQEALGELAEYGLIRVEARFNERTKASMSNLIRFADPLRFYGLLKGPGEDVGVAHSARGGSTPRQGGVAHGATKEEVLSQEEPRKKSTPKGAEGNSAANAAPPSAKSYKTDTALAIATRKVIEVYQAHWALKKPKARPPVIQDSDKAAVKACLKGIAEADHGDYLAAEEEVSGYVRTLAEQGKALQRLRFELPYLRNGEDTPNPNQSKGRAVLEPEDENYWRRWL